MPTLGTCGSIREGQEAKTHSALIMTGQVLHTQSRILMVVVVVIGRTNLLWIFRIMVHRTARIVIADMPSLTVSYIHPFLPVRYHQCLLVRLLNHRVSH